MKIETMRERYVVPASTSQFSRCICCGARINPYETRYLIEEVEVVTYRLRNVQNGRWNFASIYEGESKTVETYCFHCEDYATRNNPPGQLHCYRAGLNYRMSEIEYQQRTRHNRENCSRMLERIETRRNEK